MNKDKALILDACCGGILDIYQESVPIHTGYVFIKGGIYNQIG